MDGIIKNINIKGIVSSVPSYIEDNYKYAKIVGEKRLKKQLRITGIKKRHVSGKHQRASDLCYSAAEKLIEELNWRKKDINVMIFVTQSPNYKLPSTAFFLQKRLGLSNECVVFDVNLGCSGFVVGVQIVSALLQQCSNGGKGLLILGDTSGKVISDEKQLNSDILVNRMLFGTAGSATAIEVKENSNIPYMNLSDGNGFEAIISRFNQPNSMDGGAVFEFAINEVSDGLNKFKQKFNIKEDDIDFYIFHQAQKLILDNIEMSCDIPQDKVLYSYGEYGNTSGASVPLTACSNWETLRKKKRVNILFCGFGVGLSWGYVLAEVESKYIFPPIITDEHYDEDKKADNGFKGRNILVIGADSPIGEVVSRELNDSNAMVILTGTDKKHIENISKDMFYPSQSFIYSDLDESSIENMLEYCLINNLKLDGIVLARLYEEKVIDRLLKLLYKNQYVNTELSIVILSQLENMKDIDYSVYKEKKDALERYICKIKNELSETNIRINIISHKIDENNVKQKYGDGREWFDEFIESELPEDMKKPAYLVETLKFLLSQKGKYVNCAFMPMK